MAEGSKIELQISATGGAQAAADVAQVTKEIEAQGEALMSQGDAAEQDGPKLDRLVGIQRAQVVQQLSQVFGQLSGKIREVSDTLATADKELSESLKNVASGLDSAAGAMSGAAMGFAVGGPFGAAVGALVGTLMPQVNAAFDDMTKSLEGVARSEAFAAEMAKKLQDAQASHEGDVLASKILAQYEAEAKAIDELAEKTIRLNKLRGGKDAADAAERDAADAEAVRSGVDPEIVKKRRAVDDASRSKAAIERDIAEKNARETALRQAADKASADRDALDATPGAQEKDRDAAAKRAADAQAAAAKAQADRVLAEQLAPDKRRAIDAKTGATVAALDEQQRRRIIDEENQAREASRRQDERVNADAGRDNTKAAKIGRDAEKLLPDGLKQSFRDSVLKVVRGLQDGDQGGELAELVRLMNILAAASEKRLGKHATDIANLQGQIKNLRSGK